MRWTLRRSAVAPLALQHAIAKGSMRIVALAGSAYKALDAATRRSRLCKCCRGQI